MKCRLSLPKTALAVLASACASLPVHVTASAVLVASPARADGFICQSGDCGFYSFAAASACRVFGAASVPSTGSNESRFAVTRRAIDRETRFNLEEPDGCFDQDDVYGLQGFILEMGNHAVDRAFVLQQPGVVEAGMTDGDNEDWFQGTVYLTPLPEVAQVIDVSFRECGNPCNIPVPEWQQGHTGVLVGFDLDRVGASGGHMRNFSVVALQQRREVFLEFGERDWRYRGRVQLALVPDAHVLSIEGGGGGFPGQSPFVGRLTDGSGHAELSDTGPAGDAVLTGLSMRFQNGGHFIRYLGLERRPDGYEAWFQDEQSTRDLRWPDDPFHWEMGYALLAPISQGLTVIDVGPIVVVD